MPANKRIFYAVQQVGFSKLGQNVFTSVKGLQSAGVNTKFNLEQVFEIGQISIYENIEGIPDIEVTLEKVLDGYPLIYHLATNGSTSATLAGRSNTRSTVGLSIYSDLQDSASGTPISQCTMSGVYVSSVSYNFQVQGPSTESVTLVGNNKVWNNTFTASGFLNNDAPPAAVGVAMRENVVFGSAGCKLPNDVPGISASGTNELSGGEYGAHIQSIRVSTNLGREPLYELGRRAPYHRYATFPVEVSCDIECYSITGDSVAALEEAINLSDRTIKIVCQDGTTIDLGSKNKLDNISYTGANAGTGGGNATTTYAYRNFNDMKVTASHDPSALS
jgi:hypothetical protein